MEEAVLSSVEKPSNSVFTALKDEKDHFTAGMNLDKPNDRLQVNSYGGSSISRLPSRLHLAAKQKGLGKIICPVREKDWPLFLNAGFTMEAFNEFYFRGRPGYFMVRYLDCTRQKALKLLEEDAILEKALASEKTRPGILMKNYNIKSPEPGDFAAMAGLFKAVFSTYPTPLLNTDYIAEASGKNTLFKIIVDSSNRLVSAASAEINHENSCAEITDCATDPRCRGEGLMNILIEELESSLRTLGIISTFSIARALSPGINITMKKRGYLYGGRLMRNCHICGQFEDMNMWYKKL